MSKQKTYTTDEANQMIDENEAMKIGGFNELGSSEKFYAWYFEQEKEILISWDDGSWTKESLDEFKRRNLLELSEACVKNWTEIK